MNFNNPDDIYSSSPMSGEDTSPTREENITEAVDEAGEIRNLNGSPDSNDTTGSSARLEAALRQATAHAETQRFDSDADGNDEEADVSMEIAEDDVTTSFKPWATKANHGTQGDQENKDPYSGIIPAASEEEVDDEDMSMDITRAIGTIVEQAESQSSDAEDMSMDLTMPLGTIKTMNSREQQTNRRKSLKRRASLFGESQGSPSKRPVNRRTSLRPRPATNGESPAQDATMDFTVAIGTIKSAPSVTKQPSPSRRKSLEPSLGEETMDFTVAIGGIKNAQSTTAQEESASRSDDEDMSMEFTRAIGGIKGFGRQAASPEKHIAHHSVPSARNNEVDATRSPRRPRLSDIKSPQAAFPPQKSIQSTPKQSPKESHLLPTATSVIPPLSEQIERFESSPFVRHEPGGANTLATPVKASPQVPEANIPDDPVAAPILNRRRSSLSSVQFSPLAITKKEPVSKSSALLSNIKLLSTPRKQTLMSPSKRGSTPKQSRTPQKAATPQQKTPTPRKPISHKSPSPQKRVAFGNEVGTESAETKDGRQEQEEEAQDQVDRISLQEFLDMTKIRFMDLSTTKRRHTAAPSSFHDKEIEETEESLDRYVVAAACTLPEYELYQHACHEMKKYISDGRHFVRTMEANVMEENPLLFTEYLTAPPDQRIVMDNQFKNLKTNARLNARGEWYGWRSTLLRDLKSGLLGTMEGLGRDEVVLKEREDQLDAVLPPLVERHARLGVECKQLQQRHEELNSSDREELEKTRERLVATDASLAEKRRILAELQEELSSKEARIEAAKERKIECAAEIKAAERVREECRGWSTKEVLDLRGMNSH
jgi:kinetochore protein Spc7/SPC105